MASTSTGPTSLRKALEMRQRYSILSLQAPTDCAGPFYLKPVGCDCRSEGSRCTRRGQQGTPRAKFFIRYRLNALPACVSARHVVFLQLVKQSLHKSTQSFGFAIPRTGLPIEGASEQQDPTGPQMVWEHSGHWPEAARDIPGRNEQQGAMKLWPSHFLSCMQLHVHWGICGLSCFLPQNNRSAFQIPTEAHPISSLLALGKLRNEALAEAL